MKKIRVLSVILLGFFITGCSIGGSKDVMNQDTTAINTEAGKNVDELNVQKIMEELCSEEYTGRVAGSEENVKAGQFIKNYFESTGLEPFCEGDYYQSFETFGLGSSRLGTGNVDNVIGYIKGKDSSKAIVITAHFDHVLYNGKNVLPGAIDNASGIATLLETAKCLSEKSKEQEFDYDIVFAAFNAEELGLVGCDKFIKNYKSKYDDWYNINIDCIGMNTGKGLAVKNGSKESNKLYEDFLKVLDSKNIKYEDIPYAYENGQVIGTSDHLLFQNEGDAALIIGQNGIGGIVHTPDDNLDVIDYDNISQIKDAIVEFVVLNNSTIY